MMVAHHGLHQYNVNLLITQELLIAVVTFLGLVLAPLYTLYQAFGLLIWKFHEIVMSKIRLDSLGVDSQDLQKIRQQFMSTCCLMGVTLAPILFSVSSAIPLLLSYPQIEQFNSEVACLWGQLGFYYAWMLAASYQPFGTPWYALTLALDVKCKRASTLSLTDILVLNEKYPQLGLDTEAHMVISIIEQLIKTETPVRMTDPDARFASREVVMSGFCDDLLSGVMVHGMDKPVPLLNLYVPCDHELKFLPREGFQDLEESQSLQRRLLDDQ